MDYMQQAYLNLCQVFSLSTNKLLTIGAIIAVGFLLRNVFSRCLMKLINKFASENKGVFQQKYLVGLMRPLSMIFVIGSFYFAGVVAELPLTFAMFYQNVLKTLITFAVFWGIYSLVRPISVASKKSRKNINDELRQLMSRLVEILVVILGVLSVLQIWGVDVGAFLAGLGILGMAIGFAAQDTIKNFFGCVAILMDKTFQKGHWIKTPLVEGTVEDIGFRTTVIRQFDKALVHIPNAKLADAAVINFNKRQNRRIRWSIGLTYETSSEALQRILERIKAYLKAHPEIETDPKKVTTLINLDQFGDNAIDLFCYFFTTTTNWGEYMRIKEECIFEFKRIIEEEGSSIAYPTRTLHISSLPQDNDRPMALFDTPEKDTNSVKKSTRTRQKSA